MESKVVNKAIRSEIIPFLKANGFNISSGRSFWRHLENKIDVLNFQSFNSYLASKVECTTFSFGVNLGCFYYSIPFQFGNDRLKKKNDLLCPREFECHIRRHLLKNFEQEQLKRRDIWYVKEDGSNLEDVIIDAKGVIISDGLKWFTDYNNLEHVLDLLLYKQEDMDGTWGFGAKGSPIRHFLCGFISKKVGKAEIARKELLSAMESGLFPQNETEIINTLEKLGNA
jgi:hypothetical protein